MHQNNSRPLRRGDSLRPSAAEWNQITEAVNTFTQSVDMTATPPPVRDLDTTSFNMKLVDESLSAADLVERFRAVSYEKPHVEPDDTRKERTQSFKNNLLLECKPLTKDTDEAVNWGVLNEPLKKNGIGEVVIAGITVALVDFVDVTSGKLYAKRQKADSTDRVAGQLVASSDADAKVTAEIIWHEDLSAPKNDVLCVLKIGGSGGTIVETPNIRLLAEVVNNDFSGGSQTPLTGVAFEAQFITQIIPHWNQGQNNPLNLQPGQILGCQNPGGIFEGRVGDRVLLDVFYYPSTNNPGFTCVQKSCVFEAPFPDPGSGTGGGSDPGGGTGGGTGGGGSGGGGLGGG